MISNKSFFVSVILFLITVLCAGYIHFRPMPSFVRSDLGKFPLKIDGFVGHNLYLPKFVLETLNPDSYIYRSYSDGNGHEMVLFVAYFSTAKGGRTGHNPYACLLGAGWHILNISDLKVRPLGYREDVKVNYILCKKELNYLVSLYWYQVEKRRVLSSGIRLNMYRFKNMIFYGRCPGEYVLIFSPTSKREIRQVEEIAKKFAGLVISELPKYWAIEQ